MDREAFMLEFELTGRTLEDGERPEPDGTCRGCGEFERCPCGCGRGWCRAWELFVSENDPVEDCE